MRLVDILRIKGSEVVTIDPESPVLHAVRTLVDYNIGALVVMEEGRPVGIVSERDVLRLSAEGPSALEHARVADIMTRDVVYASDSDPITSAMETMTMHRIRHLPLRDEERLVGIVSIGDVVNALRQESEAENEHLKQYIAGTG